MCSSASPETDVAALAEVAIQAADQRADETYGYLMVFTGDPLPDVDRRSIAIEPMTCPPNAYRTGDGVIRLEPGESLRSVWGISPP